MELLKQDSAERAALVKLFSVNVTEFFRDKEFYDTLRLFVFPDLRRIFEKHDHLAIWCAGCATGEEAYSIAMLVSDIVSRRRVEIIATDRNPAAISIAEKARYKISSVRKVPANFLLNYFSRPSPDIFEVIPEVRNIVKFSVGDISTMNMPCTSFDAIFCRNVLIYMSKTGRTSLLMRFSKCLKPGGYLMLGQSEIIVGETRQFFEPQFARERIYRRKGQVRFHQAISS
jgi:chemotaxis methyl-accepting protein methylase